jgi:hypothetical protein
MGKWRGTPSVLGRFLPFLSEFPLENLAFWLKISPNLLISRGNYLFLPLNFPLNFYSYCIFYCISPWDLYFYCILPCVLYLFSIEFLSNYFYLLINLFPNNSIPLINISVLLISLILISLKIFSCYKYFLY